MRIDVLTCVWIVTLATAACSSPPQPAPDYPKFVADGTATDVTAPVSADDSAPRFPEGGPACMPAGVYVVAFDLSAAEFTTTGGMDDAFCRNMAVAVPATKLRLMKISFPAGILTVEWPTTQVVSVRGECAFDVASRRVPARIKFEGGKGTGASDYAIGSPNHADESCNVAGAKLTLEPEQPQ